MKTGPKPMPLKERFEAKILCLVDVPCWLWSGYLDRKGYARFFVRNERVRNVSVARWVYEHFVGPIPHGLEIDHLCRVRDCNNPFHLEPVTHHENLLRGESPPSLNAKKTWCANGHPLTDTNIARYGGRRDCRQCRSIWNHKSRQRRKSRR